MVNNMRLIDEDKLLENFELFYNESVKKMPEEFASLYCTLATMILQSPTAYDINNVIIKMSGMMEENVDMDTGEHLDNWVVDMQNDLIADCIQLVCSELKQEKAN